MNKNFTKKSLLGFFLIWFIVFHSAAIAQQSDPQDQFIGYFLTWKEDPTSTMVVDWHSFGQEQQTLRFRKAGEQDWQEIESTVQAFPFTAPQR